jgi:hypothetical protein
VIAIIGDKLASAAADRYLARTGYGSQLTEEPDDDGRPDNLLEPLDAEIDRGMHGRFDDRATDGDPQTWFVTHRRLATSAAAGAAALAWLARRR